MNENMTFKVDPVRFFKSKTIAFLIVSFVLACLLYVISILSNMQILTIKKEYIDIFNLIALPSIIVCLLGALFGRVYAEEPLTKTQDQITKELIEKENPPLRKVRVVRIPHRESN